MAESIDTSPKQSKTQTQSDSRSSSPQRSVLAAEEENIRRLQHEVFCIESTLRAIGKKNSCSKQWVTLKAKLDAANEELDAVLEDQQHLMSISSDDASNDHLSLTSDEHQLFGTPPGSPQKHSTLILFDDLHKLEDLLKQTPKWSLPWFEIKTEIVALKKEHGIVASQDKVSLTKPKEPKTCEPQRDVDVEDDIGPMSPPQLQRMTDSPAVYLKRRETKNESIFRRKSADDTDIIRRSISTTVKTTSTYESSSYQTSTHANMLFNVTVTVISIDGLTARKYEPKSKLPTQWKKTDSSIGDTVTIVASFCQILSGKEFQTHLPSDPIEVETSVIPTQRFPQQLVEWPNDEDDVALKGNSNSPGLSTYQYSSEFEQEKQRAGGKKSAKRLSPQTCPINISISRHGKMLSLGKANLVITGEERGLSTIVVPISIDHQKSKAKNMKKLLKGSKSNPMARIQGDNVQFGLENDAMLRVLVSVRAESSGQKVQEPNMPEPIPSLQPSGNVYEEESVEGHQDKPDKNAGNERAVSKDAIDSSWEQRIERMKASIRPLKESKSDPMLRKENESNSDELLADNVLNDVHPTQASHYATKSEPKSNDIDLLPMKDVLTKKQVYKCSPDLDTLLLEVCTSLKFDIAEMWLHEGDSSYQLINSHVQPSAVTKSIAFRKNLIYSDVRDLTKLMCKELDEVYHGDRSSEQVHRLSMSMCKWAKKTGKMLWITEHQTPRLAQALKYSISGVKAAVAVPICHDGTYATAIFFCMDASAEEALAPDAEDYLKETSEKLFLLAK